MKVLMINSVCGIGSTGRICTDIANILKSEGHECRIAYGRGNVPECFESISYRIGNKIGVDIHALSARIMDNAGFMSKRDTRKLIQWMEEYKPDIVNLHNIHGYYINIKMLFEYLAKTRIPVVFTLHDCWSFTGHCAHFEFIGCTKWKKQCEKCPQKKEYPKSRVKDNSFNNYRRKKELFTSIKDMTIVTPSKWLENLVKQSYLKEHDVRVIPNGIEVDNFKVIESNIKENLGIEGKKIILGVAGNWGERKGFYDFIKLSEMISDEYKIVLVGITKKEKEKLPFNVIGIEKTDSIKQLAELYSAADVFLNLTYEDNYPSVNLEAYACGTPVITYRTGGSIESTAEELVVEQGDLNAVWNIIRERRYNVDFKLEIDKNQCLKGYIDLYKELLDKNNKNGGTR